LKPLFLSLIALVIVCVGCAEKPPIYVEKQSFIKWDSKLSSLEVHIAVANRTNDLVSFDASLVMLNQYLIDALGFEVQPLKQDDRGSETPFRLEPRTETVFKQSYKTTASLTREMLSKGVGIQITALDKSYTITIPIVELQ
jgi:hypothetical protein